MPDSLFFPRGDISCVGGLGLSGAPTQPALQRKAKRRDEVFRSVQAAVLLLLGSPHDQEEAPPSSPTPVCPSRQPGCCHPLTCTQEDCGRGTDLIPVTGSLLAIVNIEPLAGRWLRAGSEAGRQVLEASVDLLMETSRLMNAQSGLEAANVQGRYGNCSLPSVLPCPSFTEPGGADFTEPSHSLLKILF